MQARHPPQVASHLVMFAFCLHKELYSGFPFVFYCFQNKYKCIFLFMSFEARMTIKSQSPLRHTKTPKYLLQVAMCELKEG